jgi:hypothetical protein
VARSFLSSSTTCGTLVMEFATESGTEILNVLSTSNTRLIASRESNPSSSKVLVADTCSRGIRLVEAIKSSTFSVMLSGITWLDELEGVYPNVAGWANLPAELLRNSPGGAHGRQFKTRSKFQLIDCVFAG